MLAVTSRISKVGGLTTVTWNRREGPDIYTNTVFASIAEEAVNTEIARDMDEACMGF